MKYILCAVAVAVLSGCASQNVNKSVADKSEAPRTAVTGTRNAPSDADNAPQAAPLMNQRLTTNFARRGIVVEWECDSKKMLSRECEKTTLKSIEVTAYANSFGNSENARERAFTVAEMTAKARLRHFLHEDVTSNQVVNTFSRNLEVASDRIRDAVRSDTSVEFREDANSDNVIGTVTRENTNRTVRTLTESIHASAQGILRGVYPAESKIVDRQTVSVTIRWDANSNNAAQILRDHFSRP